MREKRQVLCLSPEKSINEEERSFYRLKSYAKKNCQDRQTLTFVALFSAISGTKSRGLCVVLEKRTVSLGRKRAVLGAYIWAVETCSGVKGERLGMSMVLPPKWLDMLGRQDSGLEPWLCCSALGQLWTGLSCQGWAIS